MTIFVIWRAIDWNGRLDLGCVDILEGGNTISAFGFDRIFKWQSFPWFHNEFSIENSFPHT